MTTVSTSARSSGYWKKAAKLIRFLALVSVLAAALGYRAQAESRPPNVIIIFVDDLGYGDLGCYGAKGYETPHLDRMAEEGIRFTDFYAASSVCSASRAALLTGRYPPRTGVTGVIGANTKRALPLSEITLAESLKKRGYATAIFGKWHLGNTRDGWPLKQGFDEWFGTVGSNDMGKGRPSLEERRTGRAGVELIEDESLIETNPDQRKLTDRYTRRAIEFINRNKETPFFLYMPHNMPHTPLFAGQQFEGTTTRGLYGDVVREIDDSVGRVLKAIHQAGIDEHTMVMFSSDNGPWLIFGDHGGAAGPLSAGKKQTLEGGMRVPMIVRWPDRFPKGKVYGRTASTLDIYPTVLKLCGAKDDGQLLDGRDLSQWLERGDKGMEQQMPFYYFWERELRAVRLGKWKLQLKHEDHQTPDPSAIGNGGERGNVMTVSRPQALYDLSTDPGEKKDLSAEYPGMVRELLHLVEPGRKIAKAAK